MSKNKKPCVCYTGEIITCGDCDREYIQIDVRTYRKLDPRIKAILSDVKKREKAERMSAEEFFGRSDA